MSSGQPVVPDRVAHQWAVPVDIPCTFANVPTGETAMLNGHAQHSGVPPWTLQCSGLEPDVVVHRVP